MNLESENSPVELRPSCTRAQALHSRIQNNEKFCTLFCIAAMNLGFLLVCCFIFFFSSAAVWPVPAEQWSLEGKVWDGGTYWGC